MAEWNRFDIAFAHQALENDFNKGGWLRELPGDLRRRESTGIQLHRIQFHAGPSGGSFGALLAGGMSSRTRLKSTSSGWSTSGSHTWLIRRMSWAPTLWTARLNP